MAKDLILGTAGHIDHGKTSLIRALTGVNTDRLPEEKKRGITIELGFANLQLGDFNLGIVDVPGHEKFVRNMLAGATGVDLALLVVAADDSIKQQTIEHLDILRILNLPAGVIAITKCDASDPDWIDLVEDEIRGLVKDTFLKDATIVRTSSHTGQGIEELKTALLDTAEKIQNSQRLKMIDAPFRLAIDRVFTMEGHGAVVTGSVASGRVHSSDELEIQPGNHKVRIRGIQNHDSSVEESHRGQRAAINLGGIHHHEIGRGMELAQQGYLVPSKLLTVSLNYLSAMKKPLKDRTKVRLHVGTAEIICNVRLLGKESVQPGETCYAQFYLTEAAVSTWNQPFVIRSESPVITIGGGQILDSNASPLRKPDSATLSLISDLESDDTLTRAQAATYFSKVNDYKPLELVRTAGVGNYIEVHEKLVESGKLIEVQISPTRKIFVHHQLLTNLCQRFAAALETLHDNNPLKLNFDRKSFLSGFDYLGDPPLLNAVLSAMQKSKIARVTPERISLEGKGPKLSKNERSLLEQLVRWFQESEIASPTQAELLKKVTKNKESIPQLLQIAIGNGELTEVSKDYFVHSDTIENLKSGLRTQLGDGRGVTMSEIRDILQTTRKYAVPICEYLDKIGFTKRDGDLRVLASSEPVETGQ